MKKRHWTVIARHHWVADTTISESYNSDDMAERRFTATIRGWRDWKIIQGRYIRIEEVCAKVRLIRERIDSGDKTVFTEPNVYDESTLKTRRYIPKGG